MANKCTFIAKMKTNTDLVLTDQKHDTGKFTTGPLTNFATSESGEKIFVAKSRSGAAKGCSGYVIYQTGDATEFTLGYKDGYSREDNEAPITCKGALCANYKFSSEFPKHGLNITATYTITKIS